jgi:general secretion pathway protein B
MSFILDALKKSEIERQRQSMPGLVDSPPGTRSSRLPLWALLLGALLTINIVVLAVVLLRNSSPPAAVPVKRAETTAAAETKLPPAAAADHFSPMDPAPVYAPEISLPADEGTAAPPRTLAQHPTARPAPIPLRKADPVLVDESPTENDELLPSISEVNLTGAQALPELHLDVHVYATKPSDRFVYINMRKYHEGNTLQEGPVLERIRRDGVVLNYQGLRFVLPRQS